MIEPDNSLLPPPTPQQLRAQTHSLAPLMILAGAGTGKTTTLIRRIVHLIEHQGIPPESILALTFSEKAAGELQQRIREAIRQDLTITAATFHAFCYQTVLEFNPEFRSRRLMTDGDILFLLREHYYELDELRSEHFRREPVAAVKAFKRFFDRLRDELIQPDQFPALLACTRERLERESTEDWEETFRQIEDYCYVFPRYQDWKSAEGLVDYGDMIYQCWSLMESRPEVLSTLQERFQTIVVDEFQDNNYALNLVVERLAAKHNSLTVVGDDDQCIYSFRGASAYNISDFRQHYRELPGYAEVVLDENHRSTQPILDLANEIIRHNTGRQGKMLHASREHGSSLLPELVVGSSAMQVSYIAEAIADRVSTGNATFRDVAVLTRTHSQAAAVAAALAARDLPYQYLGGIGFFQLPAIRTALAWCAVVADAPGAPMGLYRLLSERIGPLGSTLVESTSRLLDGEQPAAIPALTSVPKAVSRSVTVIAEQISTLRAENSTSDAGQLFWRILEVSGLCRQLFKAGFLEDRIALDNLTLLLELARDFAGQPGDNSLARFVRYMDVMQEAAAVPARVPELETPDAVQVMVVHAAKGREFPVVFIPFLQSARFPLNYTRRQLVEELPPDWCRWQPEPDLDGKSAHLEEERRLLYVAVTRAQKQLIILTTPQRRSPFISNLPAELTKERILVESETRPEQDSAAAVLRSELKQRIARELARGAYTQAHQLIDAVRLVDEHERGLSPDFGDTPLARELREQLLPADGETTPRAIPLTALKLSASTIGTYETCPLQYRFARVDRIPGREDRPQLAFGRIIHAVLEAYHRPDREEPRPPLLDLLEQAWQSEGFTYPQEEAQYKADARKMLTAYQKRLGSIGLPVLAVEHRFNFNIDDITITGRIDRIDQADDGHITLTDYKTSRRKLPAKEAHNEPQLALYAMYIRQADNINGQQIGSGSVDLTYYFLRSDEPEVTVSFNDRELAGFRQRVIEAAEGIRRSNFPHRKGYHCNYCDYKDLICPAWEDPGGTLREERN